MSEPKQQHYVPQCYLREFVDSNTPSGQEPYVWMFSKDRRTKKNKAPKNILKSNDLYTVTLKDGSKDYTIEKALSALEGEYASIYRSKISKQLPLSNDEHIILCAFVSAMMQRTLSHKENLERFVDELIAHAYPIEARHGEDTPKTNELLEYKKNIHKMGVVKLMPDITELLYNMNLGFLVSESDDAHLITSDDPVNLFNPDLQWQQFYGPGLMQKKIEVTMSLSPKIMLCFSWSNLRGYISWKKWRVHEANRMIRNQAHEYIITNRPRTKRLWFSRYPYDLSFIARVILHKIKVWWHRRKIRKMYGKR